MKNRGKSITFGTVYSQRRCWGWHFIGALSIYSKQYNVHILQVGVYCVWKLAWDIYSYRHIGILKVLVVVMQYAICMQIKYLLLMVVAVMYSSDMWTSKVKRRLRFLCTVCTVC